MLILLKKLLHPIVINSCFFLLIMVGLQNSSTKSKVNVIFNQTVSLPVGFIIGSSFICGSIIGSCIKISQDEKFNKF